MQSKSGSNNDSWPNTLLSPVRAFQPETIPIPASVFGPGSGYYSDPPRVPSTPLGPRLANPRALATDSSQLSLSAGFALH